MCIDWWAGSARRWWAGVDRRGRDAEHAVCLTLRERMSPWCGISRQTSTWCSSSCGTPSFSFPSSNTARLGNLFDQLPT